MPTSVACLRCQPQKVTYALRAQAARMWAHAMTIARDRDAIKTPEASRRPTRWCRQHTAGSDTRVDDAGWTRQLAGV